MRNFSFVVVALSFGVAFVIYFGVNVEQDVVVKKKELGVYTDLDTEGKKNSSQLRYINDLEFQGGIDKEQNKMEVYSESTSVKKMFMGIKYREDFKELSADELSDEIESVVGLFDRYGVIEGLNNDSYSEAERNEIGDAIVYLNRLRLARVDKGLKNIEGDLEEFRDDVERGEYPLPQVLSDAEISGIKQVYFDRSQEENEIIQQEIDALLARKDQDSLVELGIY